MKVIQINEKQQKIVRSISWSRGYMRNQMLKQSNNRKNNWENRENQVTEKRILTEERKEITTGIRKNKEKKGLS